ncbi:unknown [Candidatus Apopatosoma intestinale]|nr:unknown [Candidatus Apopatosoma intestinale]
MIPWAIYLRILYINCNAGDIIEQVWVADIYTGFQDNGFERERDIPEIAMNAKTARQIGNHKSFKIGHLTIFGYMMVSTNFGIFHPICFEKSIVCHANYIRAFNESRSIFLYFYQMLTYIQYSIIPIIGIIVVCGIIKCVPSNISHAIW